MFETQAGNTTRMALCLIEWNKSAHDARMALETAGSDLEARKLARGHFLKAKAAMSNAIGWASR